MSNNGLKRRKARRTWKQRFERHWGWFLVTFALFIGAPIFGIVRFFDEQTLTATKLADQAVITDCNDKLASINRNLAGGNYMNVARFLVPAADRSRIPARSKFYADERFYAPELKGWSYKRMSDVDFFNSVYGQPGEKEDNPITKLSPTNVWQRGEFVPLKNHDIIHNVAPCIFVQRLAKKALVEELNLDQSFQNSVDRGHPLHQRTIFEGDIVGAMLTETFSEVFRDLRFVSSTDVELQTINKVSSVLYCQILLTLRDVTVGTRKRDRFYICFETIVLSTKDNIYTVADFIPVKSLFLEA